MVSISGQLVSLTEVRDVLLDHPFVADVEVVPRPDERRGQSVVACVVLEPAPLAEGKARPGEELAAELSGYVHETLGGLARPGAVAFVESFADVDPESRRRALRLLCAANPTVAFTVSTPQLRAAATAAE